MVQLTCMQGRLSQWRSEGGAEGAVAPGRSRKGGAKQGAQNSLVDATTKLCLMQFVE